MIVGLANYAYKKYTGLFLSSLIKNGGINLSNIQYFVFDFAKSKKEYQINCFSIMLYVLKINCRINVMMVPFEDMQEIITRFEKLYKKFGFVYFMKINLIDYLKGYLFKYIKKPFLFLDSDIIVKNKIQNLYVRCKEKDKIAMVVDKAFNFNIYFDYYFNWTKQKLSNYYVSRGCLNSGVIFIPEDYTSLWFDIYSKTIVSYGVNGDLGQGVWNVLFWLNRGYFLPQKYSCLVITKNKKVVLMHFPLNLKNLINKKEKSYIKFR